jgi:hypothetical protein
MKRIDALIEALAEAEHTQWSNWVRFQLKHFTLVNLMRWEILAETPYAKLSEHHKDNNRIEARKSLAVIEEHIDALA